MSWTSARTAIYTRWLANSPVPSGRNDASMFNGAPFTPPNVLEADPADSTWMRLQVESVPQSGTRLGINNSHRFRRGTILATFFFAPGTNEDEFGIINTLTDAFDWAQFDVVQCEEPDEPDVIGLTPNGSWFQVNETIPFYAVENPDRALTLNENILISSDPAAHGFAVGDVVAYSEDNDQWEQPTATRAAAEDFQYSAVGLVYYVPNANDFMVATGGTVTLTAHGLGTGPLYVSQSTAGLATNTKPTSGNLWNIGTAIDANRVTVVPRQPFNI